MKTVRHTWAERLTEGNCHHTQSHRNGVCEMTSNRARIQAMNRLIAFISTAVFALLFAFPANAQNPRPVATPTPDPNQAEVVNIRRVRLPITVTDKKGA